MSMKMNSKPFSQAKDISEKVKSLMENAEKYEQVLKNSI